MSRLLALLAAALVLAGRSTPAAAQGPARVLGRVVDEVTERPVAGAEIRAGELQVSSADDGSFVLGNVPPGRIELRVRRIGYAPTREVLELLPGLERSVRVALEPLPVRLDSLTATAAPGAIAIAGPDLERRGGDLARALDGWEGVVIRRAGNGPAAPQVRGSAPDEVLVLVDGFPVNDPLTGRADLSRISSREVEAVTLLPGAQTVRAGNRAVGGVLLVETRRDVRPEGSTWTGSHGALGLRLGGSAGPVTASASAERQAADFPYTVPDVRGGGEGVRRNAGGEQWGAALALAGPVEVVLRGTLADRGLPGTTTNPTPNARAEDRSVLLGARTTGRLLSAASVQWLEARASDPAPPSGAAYDAYTHGVGATAELGYRVPVSLAGWRGTAVAGAEGRGNRFAGDAIRADASFSQAALKLDARLAPRTPAWSLAPAARLDVWTGSTTPRLSARIDAGWQRGPTALTLAVGSGVTPPVLADLFFREGVGVRLNPDLRPERVRWEVEAGLRQELGGGATVGLRGFVGRVADMIVWAPDFRFIWSPRNFDVLRRGGELTLGWRARENLRASGGATYSAVTYDTPGGAQVLYRPRVTYDASVIWSPGPWTADLRWHRIGRRFPNSAGTNPRPAFSLLDVGLERRLGAGLGLRGEVRDLTDRRAEFLAAYPTPGRSVTLTLTLAVP
ncbi:MAG TPA: TonB-dependent receptor plug domain-containing protein [Gemmatimonadales bacterium]|nr:TonB-dependent receptor plug domain-containing protein [Gemmatimonadales bacterium]